MKMSKAGVNFLVTNSGVGREIPGHKHEYERVTDGKGCVWLWDIKTLSPGSHIFYHDPQDTKSQGYGGGTLVFHIRKTGEEYMAKGPWHSNADAFFDNTGIDLRDKHLTFGAIGKGRKQTDTYQTVITDVVFIDKEPTLGAHTRISTIAQELANASGEPRFYYYESSGGSSCGPVMPDGKKWEDFFDKQGNRLPN